MYPYKLINKKQICFIGNKFIIDFELRLPKNRQVCSYSYWYCDKLSPGAYTMKTIVYYYTLTGHCETIATLIADQLNCKFYKGKK